MTIPTPVPRRPDLPTTLAVVLAVAALLLAVWLGELRARQMAVLGDLRQLSAEAQHALERPSLLDVRHFARLSNLGERLTELERTAARWPVDALGRDRKAVQEAAQGLLVLGGQGKAFGELSVLLEKLRWEGDPPIRQGSPALQGLCGDNATITDMPRLRSVLGDKLQPPASEEGGAGADRAAHRGADQPMQRALALIDEFRGLRSQSLALLEESAIRAPHPLLVAGQRACLGVALLGLMVAGARWVQLWRAARRAGRTQPVVTSAGVGAAAPPPAAAPAQAPAVPVVPAAARPAAAAMPPVWLELRHAVRAAARLSAALGARASGLVDPDDGRDAPGQDETLVELLQLATPLARAREATVNLALSLLAEDADPARVHALERLDQLLVEVLTTLGAHADRRGRDDGGADHGSLVSRRDLVALQSEIGHLTSQLESLDADLDGMDASALAALDAVAA